MRSDLALAVATGLLLALASPGFHLPFLAWVAWVPLFRAIGGAGPARAAFLGAVSGATFAAATLSWVGAVLLAHTGLGLAAIAAATAAAAAAYALPHALYAGALAFALGRRGRFPIALAVLLWPALEWCRTLGPLAAPWNLLGSGQPTWSAVAQIAEGTGIYGVGATIVATNAALHVATTEPRRDTLPGLVVVTAAVVAVLGGGWWLRAAAAAPSSGALRIGLVQPAEASAGEDAIARAAELSRRAAAEGSDVIVWPEGAAPGAIVADAGSEDARGDSPEAVERIAEIARAIGVPVVVAVEGAVAEPLGRGRVWTARNRVVRIDPDGSIGAVYDKRRLVPFGETSILGSRPIAAGERPLRRGPVAPPPFDLGPARARVLVCWEAIFPALVADGAADADLLLDVTNDDWLTGPLAAEQHFALAAFRAVETRRPLVRVARSGISAVVDADGAVRARTEIGESTFRVVTVAPARGATLYARAGDAFAIGAGLASLVLLVYAGGSKRR